jgi:hypothetical protein
MVHIRPAFAYLRSSYTSTSLQQDAGLDEKNMLSANAFKSLPFSNFFQSKYEQTKAKTRLEIDKQFWHNINRVSLRGGGITNYVLMKDDIGNWTVKNYSSDPEPIIKSARNLALFGLGGGEANLLSRLEQTGATEGQVPGTPAPRTVLERQFDGFERRYKEQTATDLTTVIAAVNDIENKIEKDWDRQDGLDADVLELPPVLAVVAAKYLEEAKKEPTDGAPKEKQILDRMRALKHFHDGAEAGIRDKAKEKAKDDKEKQKLYERAIVSMTRTVREEMLKLLGTRSDSVNKFETQVEVLNESVSQ